MSNLSNTALVVIDSQLGVADPLFWGKNLSNPKYEENIKSTLAGFRSFAAGPLAPHIIHVYHASINPKSPLHPDKETIGFHPASIPLPSEPVIAKSTNSAFIKPDLAVLLKERDIRTIYFAGMSVDLCVSSTVRHASDLNVGSYVNEEGKEVRGDIVFIEDATAGWAKFDGKYDAETVHGVHVESLRSEFARIVTTKEALKELGIEG